jgi:predicted AAA+ superfamily ATPase
MKKLYLRSYVLSYIQEEIKAEQAVRRLEPFRKFLALLGSVNTEILNYSKLSRQIGIDYKTIQNYFQILEDTMIGFHLDIFSSKIREKQIQSPKFYLFDTGVSRVLNETFSLQDLPEGYSYGKLFEQFIVLEVYRLNSYYQKNFRLSYLKTSSGLEIDLIIEKNKHELVFIEIKSAKNILEEDTTNLQKMLKEFPQAKAYILSQEKNSRSANNIEILFWREGLKILFL